MFSLWFLLILVNAEVRLPTFEQFQKIHRKNYALVSQQAYRRLVYMRNVKKIQAHNSLESSTWFMGVNEFADLPIQEFAMSYLTLFKSDQRVKKYYQKITNTQECAQDNSCPQIQSDIQYIQQLVRVQLAQKRERIQNEIKEIQQAQQKQQKQFQDQKRLNFTVLGANAIIIGRSGSNTLVPNNNVDGNTYIQDWTSFSGQVGYQGVCGACYAFATSDNIAALYAINYFNYWIPLSIQQLMDCPRNQMVYGCQGGFLQGAYAYAQLYGLTTEIRYPYASANVTIAGQCKIQGGNFRITNIPSFSSDCVSLQKLLKKQPVSVGINAFNLQFYTGGIFPATSCSSSGSINHAVLAVAYSSTLWKIKNSWGSNWGLQGYATFQRNNTCNICDLIATPSGVVKLA